MASFGLVSFALILVGTPGCLLPVVRGAPQFPPLPPMPTIPTPSFLSFPSPTTFSGGWDNFWQGFQHQMDAFSQRMNAFHQQMSDWASEQSKRLWPWSNRGDSNPPPPVTPAPVPKPTYPERVANGGGSGGSSSAILNGYRIRSHRLPFGSEMADGNRLEISSCMNKTEDLHAVKEGSSVRFQLKQQDGKLKRWLKVTPPHGVSVDGINVEKAPGKLIAKATAGSVEMVVTFKIDCSSDNGSNRTEVTSEELD